MQSLNLNPINLLNILFLVNESFTGESDSVEVNKEGNLEGFKEKLDTEEQESNEQPGTTNTPELECEESAAKRRNQQGQGLKILTSDQILSRLSITLAQLKAGNNSQKLISEIRQLLYSLYYPKNITKTTYNHSINAI